MKHSLARALAALALLLPTQFAVSQSATDQEPRRVSLEQAQQALELAELAAKNGMTELSLRAVRASLAGGRPLELYPPNSRGPVASSRAGRPINFGKINYQVFRRLSRLDETWRRNDVDPSAIYEVLAAAVLPNNPREQTLLYAPVIYDDEADAPRSVGRMLVDWAERAGKLDDLARRLEARATANPRSISVHVLRALVAYRSGETAAAKEALSTIEKNLAADNSFRRAKLACHAALPGLSKRAVHEAAARVLTLAVAEYAAVADDQPLDWLSIKLAKYDVRHDRQDAAIKVLDDYLAALTRIHGDSSSHYADFLRRQALLRISQMLARHGGGAAAFERLGQALEIPVYQRYGDAIAIDRLVMSALARRLAAASSPDAYEIVKASTLPAKGRNSVRSLTGFTSAAIPPREFGLPPDPCREAFGIDLNSPITGTAAALVALAKAHGKLEDLATALEPLLSKNVENAAQLWVLVQAARGTGGKAAKELKALTDDLLGRRGEQADAKKAIKLLLVVAMAAATDDALRSDAKRIAEHLSVPAQGMGTGVHSTARFISVLCQAMEAGLPSGEALLRNHFGPWRAARMARQQDRNRNRVPAVWVVHDGVARQAAGSESNVLVFRYPLTGSFDIVLEAWDGNFAESFPGFNGLTYKAFGWNKKAVTMEIGQWGPGKKPFQNIRAESFNTYRIQVRPGTVRCFVNGDEMHVDKTPTAAAPFLTLSSSFGRAGWFRNVRIEGDPVIPREVRMLDGDRLDGWVTTFFGETKETRPGVSAGGGVGFQEDGGQPIWSVENGVLTGRIPPDGQYHQSWISYHRPLWNDESIEYEFFLDKAHGIVHPTLGRLAFLLGRDGVRLHWIVDEGTARDWTGLPPDNAAASPGSARGPRPLPLKEGAWNTVRLAIDNEGTLTIELNGTLVFERPLEPTENRLFGLYRDASQKVRVRDIVLRGDWPKQLDDKTKAGLFQAVPASTDENLARFESAVIAEAPR